MSSLDGWCVVLRPVKSWCLRVLVSSLDGWCVVLRPVKSWCLRVLVSSLDGWCPVLRPGQVLVPQSAGVFTGWLVCSVKTQQVLVPQSAGVFTGWLVCSVKTSKSWCLRVLVSSLDGWCVVLRPGQVLSASECWCLHWMVGV